MLDGVGRIVTTPKLKTEECSRNEIFFLLPTVQTGSEAHSATYSMDSGALYLGSGGKAAEAYI